MEYAIVAINPMKQMVLIDASSGVKEDLYNALIEIQDCFYGHSILKQPPGFYRWDGNIVASYDDVEYQGKWTPLQVKFEDLR